MTEVPEHLLRRSRERRAALGLGGGEGGEAGESTAVEPASAAAPATGSTPARPAEPRPQAPAPAAPAYTGPPQPPPRKERVPLWAMPVLIALPFWAIVYGGAFGEEEHAEVGGPVAIGQAIYAAQGCGGCHGPSGGGGVGPALGDVEQTFPSFADHVSWIKTGSAPFAGQPYGAGGAVATGGMPGYEDVLTEEEIVAVTCYERVEFGGVEPPPECQEGAELGEEEGGDAGGNEEPEEQLGTEAG